MVVTGEDGDAGCVPAEQGSDCVCLGLLIIAHATLSRDLTQTGCWRQGLHAQKLAWYDPEHPVVSPQFSPQVQYIR